MAYETIRLTPERVYVDLQWFCERFLKGNLDNCPKVKEFVENLALLKLSISDYQVVILDMNICLKIELISNLNQDPLYVDLQLFCKEVLKGNLDNCPEVKEFVENLALLKLSISDYQVVIRDINICPKIKLIPNFNQDPFNGDKKVCSLQKKISSYLEILSQIEQIKNSLDFLKDCKKHGYSEQEIKIANTHEMMLAGCLTIYCSFFQDGKSFSRLDLRNLKANEEQIKIHEKLQRIRNEIYAHKDNALNIPLITMWNKPQGTSNFEICIMEKETTIMYWHTNKNLLDYFYSLLNFIQDEVRRILDKDKEYYQKMLNSLGFKEKLQFFPSFNYEQFSQELLPKIIKEKQDIDRNSFFNL